VNNTEKTKQTEASDAIFQITEHAHKEISWVRSYYRFTVGAVTLLIAVGIYFTFKSASEFKTEILEDGQRAQAIQKTDFTSLGQKLRQDLQGNIDDMRKEVAKRIDAEFDSKHISELVRDKAKERIDVIADILIQKNITNQIAPIRTEFLEQLSQSKEDIRQRVEKLDEDSKQTQKTEAKLQTTMAEARELLAKLDEQSIFIMTALAAQNDDRSAFETLNKWSTDPKYQMQDKAEKIVRAIQLNYYDPQNSKNYGVFSWTGIVHTDGKTTTPVKPELLNIQDLEVIWTTVVTSQSAKGFIDNLWGNTNIMEVQKLQFLHSVIKKDSRNSLLAANRAAYLLSDALKARYNPCFDYSDIESKWAEWERTNSIPVSSTNTSPQTTSAPH
jgi:hypothetical protein